MNFIILIFVTLHFYFIYIFLQIGTILKILKRTVVTT